jgi:hypothetical protein
MYIEAKSCTSAMQDTFTLSPPAPIESRSLTLLSLLRAFESAKPRLKRAQKQHDLRGQRLLSKLSWRFPFRITLTINFSNTVSKSPLTSTPFLIKTFSFAASSSHVKKILQPLTTFQNATMDVDKSLTTQACRPHQRFP